MNLAFDVTPLQSGHKVRGMGYYTRNLLSNLKKHSELKILEFNKLSSLDEKFDVIHYPYFDLFQKSLPITKIKPTIVTIPDLTPLIFSKHYPLGLRGKINLLFQKIALKSTKAIITFSKASKKDILDKFNISPDKVFITYLSVSPWFKKINDIKLLEKISKKYKLPNNFGLFIGNVNWNKNLLNLTQATLDAGIEVVLVGKDFEDKNPRPHPELKAYREFLGKFQGNPKVHTLGFIPDNDLVAIYNLSKVVLLPSFYEGFGLPILESMACGVPVITSNISSMPEVGGDGAIYVNPEDLSDITLKIKRVLAYKEFRAEKIKKGYENLKQFSWERCTDETIKVYKYAVS